MTTELVRSHRPPHDGPATSESGTVAILSETEFAFVRMQQYAALTKLPFLCVDAATGVVLAKSSDDVLPLLPAKVVQALPGVMGLQIWESSSGLITFALPLPDVDGSKTVGVGYVLSRPDARPHSVVLAAAETEWSSERLDAWLARQAYCRTETVENLLQIASEQLTRDEIEGELLREIEDLGEQLEHTFEEISFLHSLTGNLQISRSPVELAELCLERLRGLVHAAGHVIWIEAANADTHFLVDGSVPVDEVGLARLVARFEDRERIQPLVKNNLESTLLGADFPGLKSLVLVPIAEGDHRYGWILSCNRAHEREFGTIEASLLNSIATILGTHLRNIDLYQQHDELLLSFVRSLVSTLDAKDPYTRGHSERVALIARRIGQQMNIPEEDLQDIYLSGLLHDIGKIGVDDRILRKPGSLTDEEFQCIQQHPMIGYSILAGLKNLQKILPGVRNHHENYNGKGYPDRLKGEEIPMMARILAVADSYDAMGSDRPYRQGMPIEAIEKIFRRGAGDQWDERVIAAYFSARDDIKRLCADYSPGDGNLLKTSGDDGDYR